MTNANSLPYYPRFIFNFSDGRCFSTADLDWFTYIKDTGDDYPITSFVPGRLIDMKWTKENNELDIRTYKVDKIEIHQIKYDLDEPTYGMNSNDCMGVAGKEKKWMMEIYVFLEVYNK
ncbi:hypothetical protein QNI19_18925 [Cytophagaceae bacterium DM2B3-1]|uniref:Uncharacterized protein n=1 Tax=Xanthocytophaga flava TaxID=3048013 RepID=A0ABT7CPW6_9BACT|nr:hypothetical protein [Xanthocytophaga flavus]MDJ1495020.1 hypothetical protein [Xanthocytophaga flavus]